MQVTCEKIVKIYGAQTTAVHSLDLEIASGSMHFLLGPSGCGKTTILRMLAGLEKPSSGKIFFDGQEVTEKSSAERHIGMVFQNYALWPHMTVWENIAYGLKLRKLSKEQINKSIEDVLDMTQLTRYAKRFPGQLSGGQQQRVALARSLAIRPGVLLLDEPLSNLDAKLRHEMRENITKIYMSTGITMIYVTHDQKEALSMASSISVMHGGHLIQTGTPRDLYNHPQNPFIAGFIGDTNLVGGTVTAHEKTLVVVKSSLGSLFGRTPGEALAPSTGDEVVLSIRPEAFVLLGKDEQRGQNTFSAQVTRITYLGDMEQIEFITGDQTKFRINLFHRQQQEIKIGDLCHLYLDPRDVVILPPQNSLGLET